jgi:hypothetical protein
MEQAELRSDWLSKVSGYRFQLGHDRFLTNPFQTHYSMVVLLFDATIVSTELLTALLRLAS